MTATETFPLGSGKHTKLEMGVDALWWDAHVLERQWHRARKRVEHFEPHRGPLIPSRYRRLVELVGDVVVARQKGEPVEPAVDRLVEWLS